MITVTLSSEDEQLVRQRLNAGLFRTPEEVIHNALMADYNSTAPETGKQALTLSEFLLQSPLAGSDLHLERDQDLGRDVEL
jgi:Arc/MetJ-type ribon-helix-helix transcriptional regulator